MSPLLSFLFVGFPFVGFPFVGGFPFAIFFFIFMVEETLPLEDAIEEFLEDDGLQEAFIRETNIGEDIWSALVDSKGKRKSFHRDKLQIEATVLEERFAEKAKASFVTEKYFEKDMKVC